MSVYITVTNLDPNCAHGPFNIELVDDSGAKWWPENDTEYGDSMRGYEITNGVLKIYAGKTLSEWSKPKPVTQNTVLYLKISGKVKMDSKTVAADYILSGTAAIVDPNTAISFQLGSIRISGIRLSSKLSFDPLAFLWNAFIKPGILEHT
ncbi:hypothetical protein CL1_0319 [Thermococcus cleftensis]|uniref:Uncharacterized protein n=1 Tax=Thermococcus cleftensis (strain DSM 27260 / KACC 17922 / CL1) TaxID=163003 RepID=I3ZS46_THECF|nr:hypothetical protein CL1_0319 [Thermococcus cleftensis]